MWIVFSKKYIHLYVCVLFLFIPFFSLPVIFIEILNRKRYAFILLSIFMGLCSIYYFPVGDQYRYFTTFEYYKTISLEDFFCYGSGFEFFLLKEINIVSIVLFLFSKLGFNFEFCRFVFVFISFYLMFDAFIYITSSVCRLHRYSYLTLFVLLFLSIPVFTICSGFRTGLGLCFLIYGIYLYMIRNKDIGILWCVLSIFTHLMFFVYLFFVIIAKRNEFRITFKFFIMIGVIGLFFICMFIYFRYIDNVFIETLIDVYITGDWGLGRNYTLGILLRDSLLCYCPGIWLFYYYIKKLPKRGIGIVIGLNYLFLIILLGYDTLFLRYLLVVNFIIVLGIIYNSCILSITPQKCFTLILILFISFITPFLFMRKEFSLGDSSELLYKNSISLLNHKYTDNRIFSIVDFDGNLNNHYLK